MAESQDVNTLKRRGRRRLVGAIALVLLAVIVLPMVFDPAPRHGVPPVSVRIPDEDDARFQPKGQPPVTGERQPDSAPPAAVANAPASAPAAPPAPATQKTEVPAPKAAPAVVPADEKARAEAALRGTEYVVPIAAYASAKSVKDLTSRLSASKVPYYTEPVSTAGGTVTRVRAGPFPTREAADAVLERLRKLGLKPGKVIARS